jgi:single-strand DNA-binding protein
MAGRGYNKTIQIGNLVADPERRSTTSTPLTTFRLAVTRVYSGADGRPVEATEFFRVTTWGKMAEAAARYLQKGSKVLVDGRLEVRKYTDKTTGEERQSIEIVCNELVFLGGGRGDAPLGDPGTSVYADSPVDDVLAF